MTDEKCKEFDEFLREYLENVQKELPQSYRAQQLIEGGIPAKLVIEFETRFLLQPFKKALLDERLKVLSEVEKISKRDDDQNLIVDGYEFDKLKKRV